MGYGGVSYAGGAYAGEGEAAGAAGSFPALSAEIAFESDPLDESPAWVDVTEFLRSFDVLRGRQRELDQYQTGHMTLVLDNRDRRFDSEHGTNLLTPQEASMEDGITGWHSPTNCAIVRTTAQASEGAASMSLTATAAGNMSAETSRRSPVRAGRRYLGFADYRAATSVRFCNTSIRFWDVDGNELTGEVQTGEVDASTQNTTSSWTLDAGVVTIAPTNAVFASVKVTVESAGAGGEVHYVDAVMLVEDSSSTVYVDPPPYGGGRIEPGKRCRLRATFSGVTYPVFDGFVDTWEDRYNHPNDATVQVRVSDGLKTLQQADLPQSAFVYEVTQDAPDHWWRLGEPAGSTTLFDKTGGLDLTTVGTPELGQQGLVSRDSNSSALFNDIADAGRATGTQITTQFPFTVEGVIQTTAGANYRIFLTEFIDGPGYNGFYIAVGDNSSPSLYTEGGVHLWLSHLTLTDLAIDSQVTINDGAPHHFCFVVESGSFGRCYIDGVETGAVTFGGNVTINDGESLVLVGNYESFLYGDPVTLQDIAVYDGVALPSSRVAAHAETVSTPWNDDTPGERVNRVLDAVGWPDNLREVDTGKSVMQSATLNMSALTHAQKVRDSEFGELYAARDGTIRFEGREAGVNQPSYATFGDGPGELDYVDIEYDHSDQLIRNDVTISRNEGTAQNVQSQPSIRRFQRHSYVSDGLIHDSDDTSRFAAQLILSEYGFPLKRVTRLIVRPRDVPATMFPQVLGRELTDRLTVVRRPQNVGSAISQTVRIEGIRHHGEPLDWETTWELSPAFADETRGAFWQLGVEGYSELGDTTRLFF